MRWVARVSDVDPMDAIDHKNDEGERVAEDKFADSGDGHGDTTEEVPRAADGDEGGGVRALELKETEHRAGEGDEEADDAEEGWIT